MPWRRTWQGGRWNAADAVDPAGECGRLCQVHPQNKMKGEQGPPSRRSVSPSIREKDSMGANAGNNQVIRRWSLEVSAITPITRILSAGKLRRWCGIGAMG